MNNTKEIDDACWYNTIELPGSITKGLFDWRPYFNQFGIGNIKDKTVLDVGTGNGYFAFEFEKMGAKVTALDIPNQSDRDCYTKGSENIGTPIMNEFHTPFQIAHESLGSKVKKIEMDLYNISPETVGTYDLVFCNDVLLHLTDPFSALLAMRTVCTDRIIIGTPIYNPIHPMKRLGAFLLMNEPISHFLGATGNLAFWIPNLSCLNKMIIGCGFDILSSNKLNVSKKNVSCFMQRGLVQGTVRN